MKFVNFAKYSDLEKIARARAAHFEYADRLREKGKLAVGGPLVDEENKRVGLLFIYDAASKEEAQSFVQHDPFTRANALSSYELREWRIRGVDRDLLIKANRSADQAGGNTSIRLFASYAGYSADNAKLSRVRPAHWAYDRTLESRGKLALAGPFADNEGGLFVYSAASRGEALSLLAQDPFSVEGVFKDYQLFEWLIEGVRPDLLVSDFASKPSEE